MATNYHVRFVCESDPWHYWREVQTDTIDETATCDDHPTATTKDFVVEKVEIV